MVDEEFLKLYECISKCEHLEDKNMNYKKNKSIIHTCRFCLKSEPEVEFKEVTHIISESIGNKKLFSENECDQCNRAFGSTYEDSFGKYILPFKFTSQIYGKKNTNKYKDEHQRIEMKKNESPLAEISDSLKAFILEDSDNKSMQFTDDGFIITFKRQKYNSYYVYKALEKMAFSVMPSEELKDCIKSYSAMICAIDSNIPKEEKDNILKNSVNKGYLEFAPGLNPFNGIGFELFKRKEIDSAKGYTKYLFKLYFKNFSLQIPIPEDEEKDGRRLLFKPNKSFDNSSLKMLDFSIMEPTFTCEFSAEKFELNKIDKDYLEEILIKKGLIKKDNN